MKKSRKDIERGHGVILALSRFSNLARFRFLYRPKPVSAPFQICFWPFLFPFLPLFFPFLDFHILLTYHIQIHATSSPTIGPSRTITGLRDQWDVCIHGDEMLGTSLRNMSAPAHGSKQSSNITKARALGALHTKKKRTLNGPDERRGRGGGGSTQLQEPSGAGHSQGQQEQHP